MSKAKNQRIHAKRRAEQRFGLTLSRADLNELVRQIQRGEAEFLARESNRVSRFRVRVRGASAEVIYDKQRKNIVTFFPPDTEQGGDCAVSEARSQPAD